jgi:hypothetical protein
VQVVKASREAGGNYKVEVCQADLDAYNARIAKEFAVRDFSKKSQIEILAEKELEKQKVKAERRAAKEKKKANKLAEEEAKKHGKDGPKLTKKERRALEAGF